jgi:hypothetical protein
MNRRGFLRLIGLGAAATVARRVWPFRTFSFAPAKRLFIPDVARIDVINLETWGKVRWPENNPLFGIPYYEDMLYSGPLMGLSRSNWEGTRIPKAAVSALDSRLS